MEGRSLPQTVGVLWLLFWSLTENGTVEERTFGVVPQLAPIALAHQWRPLLEEFSRQTGLSFRFATAPTVTKFKRRALAGAAEAASAGTIV